MKSIEVINMYFKKLAEHGLEDDFLMILVKVMLREHSELIPKELWHHKYDLFYYISPIIAFLMIYWYKQERKPSNLDELITRSGLKELLKIVKVAKSHPNSRANSRK